MIPGISTLTACADGFLDLPYAAQEAVNTIIQVNGPNQLTKCCGLLNA